MVVVAQKEPHVNRMAFKEISQPQTLAERCALARRMKDELELNMQILIDPLDDRSRELFSDLPSPAFIIDPNGKVVAKFPWADSQQIAQALRAQQAVLPPPPTGLRPFTTR